jgi:hypothetical protein
VTPNLGNSGVLSGAIFSIHPRFGGCHVDATFSFSLQNAFSRERVIEKSHFPPLTKELPLASAVSFSRLLPHSPDLAEPRVGRSLGGENAAKAWGVDPPGVSRYFVLECFA